MTSIKITFAVGSSIGKGTGTPEGRVQYCSRIHGPFKPTHQRWTSTEIRKEIVRETINHETTAVVRDL